MNKTFFGQNIYRILTATTYNLDVTVTNPWTIAGEEVTFVLSSSSEEISRANYELEIDIQSEINDLFSNLSLVKNTTYTLSIENENYSGSANFTVGDVTDIAVALTISQIGWINPGGDAYELCVNIDQTGIADSQLSAVDIYVVDNKSDITKTYSELPFSECGTEESCFLPEYSAALLRTGETLNINTFIVTLDNIASNHRANVYLADEEENVTYEFNALSNTEFELTEVDWRQLLRYSNKITLNVVLMEPFALNE